MQGLPLIILFVIGAPIATAIWLIVRAVRAGDQIEALSRRVRELEHEVFLKKTEAGPVGAPAPVMAPRELVVTPRPVAPPSPMVNWWEKPTTPFDPVSPAQAPEPESEPEPEPKWSPEPELTIDPPPRLPRREPVEPAINWEQFMGVKGFAWIGGFALFLGVAFFIKYSFDNNLISPALRVAIGFLTGLGLVTGGVVMSRRNFPALSQTLCATGVVVLYAITFACRALYHFPFFGPAPTFMLMALITTAAFLLAQRMNALVVAILGMLGGFLTPVLLSTGQDNPLGLFGYIAILDAGLILVALDRRWHFLTALAAAGTVLMEIGWTGRFFVSGKYFEDGNIFITLGVLLGFNALYLAANWLAKRRAQSNWPLAGANLGLAVVAFAFTMFFLSFESLAHRPVLLFGFVFLIDLGVAALAWIDEKTLPAQPLAGLAVFGLMAAWTSLYLTNAMLPVGLALYLVFAVFHSVLPVWWQRQRGTAAGGIGQLGHLFPLLALALVLLPILNLSELPFVVWPFVLLVDLLAIGLAVTMATLLPVLAALLLTLGATALMICKIPANLTGLPTGLSLIGGFAIFFAGISVWLARKFKPDAFKTGLTFSDNFDDRKAIAALLPVASAVMPFLLLIMATLRLPLANPSPVFGLALLLVALVLGMARLFLLEWMPLAGLVCTVAVEWAWHSWSLDHPQLHKIPSTGLLGWYLVFQAIFAIFPFVFLKRFAEKSGPWMTAALAGPAQFILIYSLVKTAWPNPAMGLVPAAFAVPALLSLAAVLKWIPAEGKARMTQLAWFGGVALFFITLIFPIQFDRQWITIGWALEGAALLWLFHRVPHPGLRLTGLGLLVAAFARLALNPAVLEYHARAATPIFNWYLYTYGIVTVALFVGGRLLAPPRHRVADLNAPAVLGGLGTTLAFLLLNIEIADYFSAPGATLTFQFSGNFARDMTYSIAWAVFALGLLVFGIVRKNAGARYPAMALLCVTIMKLFFHDLAQLGQLYRIGAFIGVAFIAMLASFAYQKFFSSTTKPTEAKNENEV